MQASPEDVETPLWWDECKAEVGLVAMTCHEVVAATSLATIKPLRVYLANDSLYTQEHWEGVLRKKNVVLVPSPAQAEIVVCEYEDIDWEEAYKGCYAVNWFCMRKALCRKANLALTINTYCQGRKDTPLRRFVPASFVIETWSVFDPKDIGNASGLGGMTL